MPKPKTGWIRTYGPGEYRGRPGWHVRGRDIHGRAIEGKIPGQFASKIAAERFAVQLLDRANSRPPDPAPEPVEAAPDLSFRAAAAAYKRIRQPSGPDAKRIDRLIACPTIGPVDVRDLTTDQAAAFALATLPGRAPDTLNREVITMYSAVINYASEQGWRSKITIRRFQEEEDENRAAQPAEIDAMLAHADMTGLYARGAHGRQDANAPYKVALLDLLRLRGMRISDALRLRRDDDLDLPAGKVRLTIGKRRNRVVWLPLNPKVVSRLANLSPCEGGFVFPWRTRFGVYKWWRPLTARLGLSVTPHQFRHALGTEMIDASIDLLTLKGAMGSATLNSVRRYARPSEKRLRQADDMRATEAGRSPQHREMTAGDLFGEASPGVVDLARRAG